MECIDRDLVHRELNTTPKYHKIRIKGSIQSPLLFQNSF